MTNSLSKIKGGSNFVIEPLLSSSNLDAASPILPLLINPSRKNRFDKDKVEGVVAER
jgi:hypothetical protein